MKKILVLLCAFIMINYIQNELCTSIGVNTNRNLRNLDPLTDAECQNGETNDDNTRCYANNEGDRCISKSCEDFAGSCSTFIPKISTKICKEDDAGCRLVTRTCAEMDSEKCGDLIISDTEKCEKMINENQCEPVFKTCSEMDAGKCGLFTPQSDSNICAINTAQDGCIERPKVCTDMPSDNCGSFTPPTKSLYRYAF